MKKSKMILNIFAIILLIKGISAQNCQLNATHMDKKWIFAIKPSPISWDVLHTDYIRDQTTLHLICKNINDTKEYFCNRGVLQPARNSRKKCGRHLEADVVLQPRNDNSCRRMRGNIYNVVYNLANNVQIPLYDVCYSTEKEQTLFTKHRAYGFSLPASTYKRPSIFKRSNFVTAERAESFTIDYVYNRFNQLLGAGQTFIPNNTVLTIARGHLTNCQDFPTYDQLDATFKFVNVVPQFSGSNLSNWRRIENWLHRLVARDTYADVVSGIYGTLTLLHSRTRRPVEMYLLNNNKNNIPLWLYKVIRYNNNCYAFAVLNNDFNKVANVNSPICNPIACPNGISFISSGSVGYCCNYYHLVRQVGLHAALC